METFFRASKRISSCVLLEMLQLSHLAFLDLQQELYIIYVVMTQQLHSHDGGTRRVLDSAFCAFCRVRFAARGSGGLIMVQQESGKKKLRCLFPDLGS